MKSFSPPILCDSLRFEVCSAGRLVTGVDKKFVDSNEPKAKNKRWAYSRHNLKFHEFKDLGEEILWNFIEMVWTASSSARTSWKDCSGISLYGCVTVAEWPPPADHGLSAFLAIRTEHFRPLIFMQCIYPWVNIGKWFSFQSVWGSYWHEFQWGYTCCHSFVKMSYCTGEAGKKANEVRVSTCQRFVWYRS